MDFYQQIADLPFINGLFAARPAGHIFTFDDKSNYDFVDLKDFFTFFKVKPEKFDISLMEKYEKKQKIESRFRATLHSFSNMNYDENLSLTELIPFHMFESFAEYNNDFYQEALKQLSTYEIFDSFFDFYIENIELFQICNKLNSNFSFGSTSFEFAENFRFKSHKNTFDLFHLKKEERNIVVCEDDFVIYGPDYKQFEFRTFLDLIQYDKSIFNESIYDFLGQRMNMKPEKVKLTLISWMYSSYRKEDLDQELDKTIILDKLQGESGHFASFPVFVGLCEPHKAIHTIVQTVSQFRYIEKLQRILGVLEDKRSKFVFPLHDSMIFFIHKFELEIIDEIDAIMEDDVYKTKKYIGKNYKEMEEI